jgi:hypothetical protein
MYTKELRGNYRQREGEMTDHGRWAVLDSELDGLDARKARDLMVRCFYESQKEVFARARQKAGAPIDDSNLFETVQGAIKTVFRETGANYLDPKKEELNKVMETLARKAATLGTPDDIIRHHMVQMQKVMASL